MGTNFLCLLLSNFSKNYGKDWIRMDKRNLRILALTVLNNELPDVKVFFEDKGVGCKAKIRG